MTTDGQELTQGTGELTDKWGRPILVLTPKHTAIAASGTWRAYQPADADGRLQVVLQDRNGTDLASTLSPVVSQVYASGPIGVSTNTPTDVAITPGSGGIALANGQQITAIAYCIIQPGTGTTQLNLGFGIHHPDGSGGTTWENLVLDSSPVPGSFRTYSRMSVYTTTQAWTDATIRFAITQVGASGNGGVYGVGLRVFSP